MKRIANEAAWDAGRSGLEGFVDGDPAAIRHVESVARGVIRHRGYYVPASEHRDLAQHVLLETWRAARAPDFQLRISFDAFVRTLAHRACVDWLRRQRPQQELDVALSDPTTPVDEEVIAHEQLRIGRSILAGLGARCRTVIELHVVQRLSYRDIARREGLTEGTLRNRMSSCLKEARRIWRELAKPGKSADTGDWR